MSRTTDRCAATIRGVFLTRRVALRALFSIGVVAGTAGALAPILARRGGGSGGGQPGRPGRAGTGVPRPELERFAEMYRGRHIQGTAIVMVPAHGSAGSGDPVGSAASGGTAGSLRPREARAVAAVPSVEVRIDGRPLHVMRRADGSYLSLVNHYESFPTLLDVARAAVDELGTAQLSMSPLHHV